MHVETFRLLLTDEGGRALAAAARPEDPVRAVARLRKDFGPDLTSAALTQVRLRARAREKFGPDAERMFFTPDGLEQATRLEVAEHRARRFGGRVADLCCGIGGDLIALARAGCEVEGFDADPLTAEVARANVDALGLRATIHTATAESPDPAAYDGVFIDPARRAGGRRVFDPDAYSPPWPVVMEIARQAPFACVKVAPGIPHEAIPAGAEAEWISYRGAVKEASIVLSGIAEPYHGSASTGDTEPHHDTASTGNAGPHHDTASTSDTEPHHSTAPTGNTGPHHGSTSTGDTEPHHETASIGEGVPSGLPAARRATLLPSGASLIATGTTAEAGPPGAFLYEPDGAVVRAHLVAEAANEIGGHLLDPRIAYITSDKLSITPWAQPYRIDEVLPFSLKRLRATLRARGVGRVTIMKRGSAVDVDELSRNLRLSGENTAVVALTRIGAKPYAFICGTV